MKPSWHMTVRTCPAPRIERNLGRQPVVSPFSRTMLGAKEAGDLRNLPFSMSQTLWPRLASSLPRSTLAGNSLSSISTRRIKFFGDCVIADVTDRLPLTVAVGSTSLLPVICPSCRHPLEARQGDRVPILIPPAWPWAKDKYRAFPDACPRPVKPRQSNGFFAASLARGQGSLPLAQLDPEFRTASHWRVKAVAFAEEASGRTTCTSISACIRRPPTWFQRHLFPSLPGVNCLVTRRIAGIARPQGEAPTLIVSHEALSGTLSSEKQPGDNKKRLTETLSSIAAVAPGAPIIIGFREHRILAHRRLRAEGQEAGREGRRVTLRPSRATTCPGAALSTSSRTARGRCFPFFTRSCRMRRKRWSAISAGS